MSPQPANRKTLDPINASKNLDLNSSQGILAEELAQRLADDEADHRRRARTLTLHYTGGSALRGAAGVGGGAGRSRQAGYVGACADSGGAGTDVGRADPDAARAGPNRQVLM